MVNKKNSQILTAAVLLSCSCLCMPWYAQAQDNSIHKDDIIHGDDIGNDENHKKNYWEVRVPNAKGEKQSFAIFDVYDKTNDPGGYDEEPESDADGTEMKDSNGETETPAVHKNYRDFQAGEKEAITDSLTYFSDMLGFANKDNLPLIELKLKDDKDDNAGAMSETAAFRDNKGKLTSFITGTELAEAIQAKDKLNGIPAEKYHAGVEINDASEKWYYDKFPILPENGTQSDYYGTVTHEMFHALGLAANLHNELTGHGIGSNITEKSDQGYDISRLVLNKYEVGLRDVFGRVSYYGKNLNWDEGDHIYFDAPDKQLGPDDGKNINLPSGYEFTSRTIKAITLDEYNELREKLKDDPDALSENIFYILQDEEKPEPDLDPEDNNSAANGNSSKDEQGKLADAGGLNSGRVSTQGGVSFTGKNVREVLTVDGKVAEIMPADGVHNIAVKGGIPINCFEGTGDEAYPELSHIELQNSLMSHQSYRNWCTFMEAELALLQDLGYDIDRSKYFGKSIYNSGSEHDYFGTINSKDWSSSQRQAIGLHVYGSYVDVKQAGSINASGNYSMGIRVDGVGNKVNIANYVSANGVGGNALAVTYGKEHAITLQKEASLVAMGNDGVAARFDFGSNELGDKAGYRGSYINAGDISGLGWTMDADDIPEAINGALVKSFDVNGTLAGKQAAIYISPNAYVQNINVMNGTSITGDIISKWNPEAIIYQNKNSENVIKPNLPEDEDGLTNLTFGVKADDNGNAIFDDKGNAEADESFKLNYDGNIKGAASLDVAVMGGELAFNGDADVHSVAISEGATLSGEGNYKIAKNSAFTNNGTFNLSQHLKETKIDGNYQQNDTGTLVASFNGQNQADTLKVTGTANLAGKVLLAPVAGYYSGNTTAHIIDASNVKNNGVTAELMNKDVSPILNFAITSQGTGSPAYTITASRDADAYSKCADDPISAGIAEALNKNAGSVQGDAQNLVGAIDFAGDKTAVNAAMKRLNPSIYNSSAQATLNIHNMLNTLDFLGSFSTYEPADSHTADAGKGRNAWRSMVMPFYSYTDQHNGLRGYTNHDSGVLGAMERTLDSGWTMGYHVAVNHQSTSDSSGSVKGEGFYAGTQASYAPAAWNGWSVFGSASVGIEQMRSHRNMYIGSYNGAADAKWTGYSGSLRLGTALTKETHAVKSGPFAAVQYSFVHRPSITEDGGAIRAHINSETYDSLRTQLGYQLTTRLRPLHDSRTQWQAYISAAWNHELLGDNGTTTYQLLDISGTTSIRDTAALYGRDSLSLMAGLTFRTPKKMDISMNIGSDMYRQGGSSIYGKIGLKWKF